MNLAENSIKNTLVIGVTEAPETSVNLKYLIDQCQLQSLADMFQLGISADVKVLQILYRIMGSNSQYPCLFCEWPSSTGLTDDIYPERTIETITDNFQKLQNTYNGNSKHAKHCKSIEHKAILTLSPKEICKIPVVHLNLLTNTIYKNLKKNCTSEELEKMDNERKEAGVVETKYHGSSLEGKVNNS